MQEIIEYVSSRHADSLNREGDVELLMLKKVSDLHILHILYLLHLLHLHRTSLLLSLFLCFSVSVLVSSQFQFSLSNSVHIFTPITVT
jgi:hypothetical protein